MNNAESDLTKGEVRLATLQEEEEKNGTCQRTSNPKSMNNTESDLTKRGVGLGAADGTQHPLMMRKIDNNIWQGRLYSFSKGGTEE